MTNYTKGTRNEHKTMAALETAGYTCTRAAGSHGMWDVIAIHPTHIRLIQVKTNHWPDAVEQEKMDLFKTPLFVSKEIWRWNDFARQPLVRVLPSDVPLGGWECQGRLEEWLNGLKGE
jgi:hypothetical protein